MPGPPLPCIASDGPPVTPADWKVLPGPACFGPAERSRLCFVWPAPTWPAALSLCLHSPCALSLVPCDTSSPTPRQQWPPTVPRRPCARAGYEMQTEAIPTSAPGDRAPTSEEPAPIKMINQQLDAPVHDYHCTLSPVTTLGPLCTKNCAPDKGNIATPQYTHIPLFRLYRARNPCPETLYPISRYRVK